MAEAAADNNVAIGLDFTQLEEQGKSRMHTLAHWRKNLKLCEKYDTPYLITTGAEEKHQLRGPRELKSLIDSLDYSGRKAVSETPKKILEKAEKSKSEENVRLGVEKK
jgi:RNase P/RNase MRP subunit p30